MSELEITKLARHTCFLFNKNSNPRHSDTYTFTELHLIDFAKKLEAEAERKAIEDCRALVHEQTRAFGSTGDAVWAALDTRMKQMLKGLK